ncbi:hypothetical protein [Thiolapillus sp.]|uniref:hypothetical protein n=6 Tax=Thiolapillus sp. TaxID=2017437 RepID=UPI003AF7A807
MQPSVPNGLLRSDLDGKGLLPQVTQASHSELSEADQYRGGQGGAMNIFVYRQGTTNCLVSHKTIMAIHNKGYIGRRTRRHPLLFARIPAGHPSWRAAARPRFVCHPASRDAADLPKNHPGSNPGYVPARLIPWPHVGMEENNE